MIRTFQALRSVEPGFSDRRHLQTMRISVPPSLVPNPERVTRIQNEITDKLAAIPEVSAAGFGSQMPMEDFGSDWDEPFAENRTYPGSIQPLRLYKYVSPGFFHAAGTRILAGQDITWSGERCEHWRCRLCSESRLYSRVTSRRTARFR
jgi:hypothetical protein